jgi:hypothetical protein
MNFGASRRWRARLAHWSSTSRAVAMAGGRKPKWQIDHRFIFLHNRELLKRREISRQDAYLITNTFPLDGVRLSAKQQELRYNRRNQSGR